jgi:hypothetical protein
VPCGPRWRRRSCGLGARGLASALHWKRATPTVCLPASTLRAPPPARLSARLSPRGPSPSRAAPLGAQAAVWRKRTAISSSSATRSSMHSSRCYQVAGAQFRALAQCRPPGARHSRLGVAVEQCPAARLVRFCAPSRAQGRLLRRPGRCQAGWGGSVSTPSRNGSVTAGCLACGGTPRAGRPRTTCSDRCRQALFRRHHEVPSPLPAPPPPGRSRKQGTVYECPECETRLVGAQICDCGAFMRRLGAGGCTPCCGEVITVEELLAG